jgi:hypothetical protein
MRISRLILSGAAIGTIIGTGRADLNSTHVYPGDTPDPRLRQPGISHNRLTDWQDGTGLRRPCRTPGGP